jgi:hypothetical protein
MATGRIILPIGAATPPDNSTTNLPAAIRRVKSSATAPSPHFIEAQFADAAINGLHWSFPMPGDYASAPVLKAQLKSSVAGNNVRLDARIAAYTPDTDTTSLNAKALAAANLLTAAIPATTAERVTDADIALANADSLAALDFVVIFFSRLGADAADTNTGVLKLVGLTLEYTTT